MSSRINNAYPCHCIDDGENVPQKALYITLTHGNIQLGHKTLYLSEPHLGTKQRPPWRKEGGQPFPLLYLFINLSIYNTFPFH